MTKQPKPSRPRHGKGPSPHEGTKQHGWSRMWTRPVSRRTRAPTVPPTRTNTPGPRPPDGRSPRKKPGTPPWQAGREPQRTRRGPERGLRGERHARPRPPRSLQAAQRDEGRLRHGGRGPTGPAREAQRWIAPPWRKAAKDARKGEWACGEGSRCRYIARSIDEGLPHGRTKSVDPPLAAGCLDSTGRSELLRGVGGGALRVHASRSGLARAGLPAPVHRATGSLVDRRSDDGPPPGTRTRA